MSTSTQLNARAWLILVFAMAAIQSFAPCRLNAQTNGTPVAAFAPGKAMELQKLPGLDPTNAADWNRLADYYGHHGQGKQALEYYAVAVELKPTMSDYHRDLARAIILFRTDAREFYHADEQVAFNRAMESYQKAMQCDPTNYTLAVESARTFYSVAPFRTDAALAAWTNALQLAHTELEQENVYLNAARINANAHRFDEAHKLLNLVTNDANEELQGRVAHVLRTQETRATNGLTGGQN